MLNQKILLLLPLITVITASCIDIKPSTYPNCSPSKVIKESTLFNPQGNKEQLSKEGYVEKNILIKSAKKILTELAFFKGSLEQAIVDFQQNEMMLKPNKITGKLDEPTYFALLEKFKHNLPKNEITKEFFKIGMEVYAVAETKCEKYGEWALLYKGLVEKSVGDKISIIIKKRYAFKHNPAKKGVSKTDWFCAPKRKYCYSEINFSAWQGKHRPNDIIEFLKANVFSASIDITTGTDKIFQTVCGRKAMNINVLKEIAAVISEKHLDKPKLKASFATFPKAINAYLQSLDPYSKYLTVEEYKFFKEQKSKVYVGIGASIRKDKQSILIIPFAQSPAFKAGIKTPHILHTVNGVSVESMTINRIKTLIKGFENTFITLETYRLFDDKQSIRKTTLKRKKYHLNSIHQLSDDNYIPYIRINKFVSRKTLSKLKSSLQLFKGNGSAIILDLRETTGGDLYETFDCLSLFLPAGELLATTVNNQGHKRNFNSLPNNQIIKEKILLLVSPRTASSAEIFAKALQYHKKALLIGQETYGKCLSQTYIEISDGSALKLTNLKIIYPDNKFCNGNGLVPDIIVDDKQLYETHTLISKGERQLFQ
ncbi:MAG: hypothetical protein KAH84_05050 [Thiomargarita sp.]|nr:hypothetical protein [Thiomargarita sp.]